MIIIELIYKVDILFVDKYLLEHREWLDMQYGVNKFLCSGRKVTNDGGVIIALIKDRCEVEELIKSDPFYINDVAEYKIIEFVANKSANSHKSLLDI